MSHHVELFRETKELSIEIPALPQPTLKELRKTFDPVFAQAIKQDTSPTNPVTLRLATVFVPNSRRIIPKTWEDRLAPHLNIALGYQHAAWLIEHKNEIPAFLALRSEIYGKGVYAIDFPGLVMFGKQNMERRCFILDDGVEWELGSDWCDRPHFSNSRIAIAGCR